jgi:aerobic carbon-monoxide dehydrogenase medium subunit
MYQTNYHRAASVADAVKKMKGAEDGKYLSGGMTLIPTMKQRLASPSDVIDLTHIGDMKGVKISGKTVTIGAATTHADVAMRNCGAFALPSPRSRAI